VEVVAGVDRRRVDLLKLSFHYRERASYLLLGGPALRDEAQRSIAVELEANGVPTAKIWAGDVPWNDEDGLTRHVVEQLPAVTGQPARKALPSAGVPTLTADDELIPPRRVPRAAWAMAAAAAVGVTAFAVFSTVSGDAAAREAELALAGVAAPLTPTADPEPEETIVLEAAPEEAPPPIADEEPPAALPSDDGALVYAALRNQSIRAIDILLVSPPATRKRRRRTSVAKLNYEKARAYCRDLDVDGVVGWRLPAIGEAQWLSRSNLIRNGIYWTATKADAFGDERVTWNPRAKRMKATGQRWRGGRAICVRFSNADDPGPG
jgi:hypothetical protein